MPKAGGEEGAGRPSAFAAAVRLLAARALTESEVHRRLAAKGYPGRDIDAAVRRLVHLAYLNDRLLAYNTATSHAARRLLGPRRITAYLRRRGVADEIVAETVGRVFAEIGEEDLALKAAGRIAVRGGEGLSAGERILRALLRRGFTKGAVVEVLKRLRTGRDDRDEADAAADLDHVDDGWEGDELEREESAPERDEDEL